MKEGWIKLYRQVQDCWIWEDKEPFDKRSAWVDLLLLANHSDKKILLDGELITIERGQILTSIRKLSDRWKWSVNKVYRFLRLLENDKMLQKKSNKHRTLLTLENYGIYQGSEYTNGYTDGNKNDTVTEHKQECKEIKNNICSNSSSDSEDKKKKQAELETNFKIIYDSYPKKVGKTRGFELYKGWLKGRDIGGRKIKLTNKHMWLAIARYKQQLEEADTELKYYKNFDVFMNKSILDYIEEGD